MARITEDMRYIIGRARLSFVATVCPDGTPNLSPKATLAAWDDEHLVFADIRSPQTIANLRRNPAVEVNVVDVFLRRGYRFKGRAEILEDGPIFDEVAGRLWGVRGRGYPVNAVAKIKVEKAGPVVSPAYVFGDPIPSEAEVKEEFLRAYGVRELAPQEVGV